ncbi:Zinc carboxypeptidase [Marinomonas spartinae]|uniref:Zinc carboxypeptidase n=1 Tax=Marinomonas spartinae TaxID=1792290 RepID=A0A1A8TFR7_9GAMM|nr:DUF2817 domain-containing protein [Marinomonas spartinae]SBS31381.1 Zinc carboxypeptidase [Marinomonas spartinae]
MQSTLSELAELQRLLRLDIPGVRRETLAQLSDGSEQYPVDAVFLGSDRPNVPTFLLVGGVHGVERIGSQVVLAYLNSLLHRLIWDQQLQMVLDNVRFVCLPVLNPVGMARQHRGNVNGVDLMRNAPIDAFDSITWPFGGQRLTRHLPWFRGGLGKPLEMEAQALCDLVERLCEQSPIVMALDVHSGFGTQDRLWFPMAGTRQPVPHIADYYALKKLLKHSHPNHRYLLEPQSHHYLCHGDLWDYLYLKANSRQQTLLPLTLELGSWRWVKKNPLQLRSFLGMFHPIKPHRVKRVLRENLYLIEILWRASANREQWLPKESQRQRMHKVALKHWYQND